MYFMTWSSVWYSDMVYLERFAIIAFKPKTTAVESSFLLTISRSKILHTVVRAGRRPFQSSRPLRWDHSKVSQSRPRRDAQCHHPMCESVLKRAPTCLIVYENVSYKFFNPIS
ncbi:hypothetical protein EVAR_32462_1 [Eumeta japonica]|uniref:Uncharacterized protein n=1 Tax=Eumeta variegata TaxID=151549 RepID=A0A4C1VK97_EUMVA|nr:hypothetical protein EVAR_32462_1 [Eumeta japonica]